jgi:hypothetical protein
LLKLPALCVHLTQIRISSFTSHRVADEEDRVHYFQSPNVTLGLRREQFVACTRSVARGHVRKEEDKAEVVGDNEAFWVSDKPTLASLDELKLLAG